MLKTTKSNPILRKLLQLDRPVPQRTNAEVTAERDRNYSWNFAVNLLDVTSFWFGLSFISAATIIPLYVSKLTPNPFFIGLVAVISRSSWFLPQIFTANFTEELARKKPMPVNLGFFTERLPVWILIVSAAIALSNPTLALIVFLISYIWFGFGAGLVATAWQDLIARIFPVHRRGRFFGISSFIGGLIGSVAAILSAPILASAPFPTNFIYTFTIAAIGITISWFFLALTREPVQAVKKTRQSTRQFWSDLPRILRSDNNYRHFLIARLLLALSSMGIGFVTVAAIRQWDVADGTVGTFTALLLIGQTAANLFLGILADRFGHVLSLEIGAVFGFAAFMIAWLAPSPEWYFLVFVFLGVTEGAIFVSGIPVVLEFSPPEKGPTYTGMTNTSVGIISVIGPMIGAALALISYNWLFGVSALISLLAFIAMRWWVLEPRFEIES